MPATVRRAPKEGIAIAKRPVLLVNSNRIRPPVASLGLEYLAGALQGEGCPVELVDLSWSDEAGSALADALQRMRPRMVAVSFRNSDDCFWPSAHSFVPELCRLVGRLRALTDAPLVLGGAGFSVFPLAILRATGCEFGIRGEGEHALARLARALGGDGAAEDIPGLAWRTGEGAYAANPPRPAHPLSLPTGRDHLDNRRYFAEGGQAGLETKRGCGRRCTYCADPLIKGRRVRTRHPAEVADEVESLLAQDVDVLHLCDSEFNVPYRHAMAVCAELARRGLGERVRWYTYAAVTQFDAELAAAMREAGCVGVNFGADSASPQMLSTYGRRHGPEDIASAVQACHEHDLRVMTDLLLGGPGETEETLRETIEFMKRVGPDCVGAALGVRLYPGTSLAAQVGGDPGADCHLRRGEPLDPGGEEDAAAQGLLQPAFYISAQLGQDPAGLVCDLVGEDERFFKPMAEQSAENYNYNENEPLTEAIRAGARGAYWDILRGLK
ncbi:MAG: radical SAM protein [Candidatus Brocadiia bacterium]